MKLRITSLFVLVYLLSITSQLVYSQSIKRHSIACYGASIITDNIVIRQTAGQSYCTSYKQENILILQGFQQPNTLKVSQTQQPEINILKASVYPNPATNNVFVFCEHEIPKATIQVFDINGKIVFTNEVENLQNFDIKCERWIPGIYFLSIMDEFQVRKTTEIIISK